MSHRLGADCSEAQTNCNFPLPRCCQDLFAADIPTEICIGIIVQSTAQHIAFLGSANREELTGTMAYEVYKVLTQQQCERRNCAYMHSHKHPPTHPPARPPTHAPTHPPTHYIGVNMHNQVYTRTHTHTHARTHARTHTHRDTHTG